MDQNIDGFIQGLAEAFSTIQKECQRESMQAVLKLTNERENFSFNADRILTQFTQDNIEFIRGLSHEDRIELVSRIASMNRN